MSKTSTLIIARDRASQESRILECDADGTLYTSVTSMPPSTPPILADGIKVSPHAGSKTVSATGTAEPLVAPVTPAQSLFVRAKAANLGNVYFGDSLVDKTNPQEIVLDATEWTTVSAAPGYYIDLHDFYIDVDTNGEGVDFLYLS
jgi:hypothetical protein